jgi:hypothetical protein
MGLFWPTQTCIHDGDDDDDRNNKREREKKREGFFESNKKI